MRFTLFFISLALTFGGSKTSAQELRPFNTKSSTQNPAPHKDSIVRPSNVASHAYLAESDQKKSKVFVWMEYGGLVDSLNNIHKISMYWWDGTEKEDEYYMLVDGDPSARINLNDYQIGAPFGRIKHVESKGIKILLYVINYKDSELDDTGVACYAKDKENYTLVSAFSNNKNPQQPSPINPEAEVYIKVDKHQGNSFSIVIQDDRGKITRGEYKLVSYQNMQFKGDKLPFFYYHIDSKRICLLNGMYLEPI